MDIIRTELSISKEVAGGVEEYVTVTPPAGSFFISKFIGSGAFSVNCAVKLIWDIEGTPELLWSVKGEGYLPYEVERTGNGIKKLGLALDNGLDGPVAMSGFALIVWGI